MTSYKEESRQKTETKLREHVKTAANILIIEDDRDTAAVMCELLKREGYGVRSVSSRDDAVRILDSYLYDVIIMDLFMPGLGPQEFIEIAHRHHPRSKFILLTAFDQVASSAQQLGISYFLGKPFLDDELISVVQNCVD